MTTLTSEANSGSKSRSAPPDRADEQRSHQGAEHALDKQRGDALASTQADRAANQSDKTLNLYGPGDTVDQPTRDLILKGNPGAAGLFQNTPGAQVTQTQGIAALPQSAQSGVGTLKMSAPVMPAEPSTTTTDVSSPLNAPSLIKFRGTGSQRQAATKEADLVDKTHAAQAAALTAQQAKVDEATQRLQIAWAALSEKSASDTARGAAQADTIKALTALREAQAQLADARKNAVDNQGDPIIGPQFKIDNADGTTDVYFPHKSGTLSKQTIKGTPTRIAPAQTGFGAWLKSMLPGSDTSAPTPRGAGDPTDPNWGK